MSITLIEQVVELTNVQRVNAGLQPLKLNTQLVAAAQDHSDDMAQDDFFSHTGVDGSTLGDRVLASGYQYSTAGENLAAGQTTAEQVVEGWMNSPGHRANMLNPNFTEIGVGYEYLQNDTGAINYNHYWTQVFGTPLNNTGSQLESSMPEPQPAPIETVEEVETVDGILEQVVELTNVERVNAGLQPLKLNTQLVAAAQDHSDDMAQDDFFSHTGVDGSTLGDRVFASGYQYSTAGENIAAGQTTAEQVVEGWMNSPGHRANILNPNFTEIGVGYEYLQNDTGAINYNHYWTQVFGTPLNNNYSDSASSQDILTGQTADSALSGDSELDLLNDGSNVSNTSDYIEEYNNFSEPLNDSSLGSTASIQEPNMVDITEYISNSDLTPNQKSLVFEMLDLFM